MDTQTPAPATEGVDAGQVEVEDAEVALVEHYSRLVRMAYVTLPATMGRHRRVLLAHRIVQRALPRTRQQDVKGDPGGGDPAYALVRDRMLRGALAYGRRRSGWRRLALAALVVAPVPPKVMGLRLFPRVDGTTELALDRTLAELDAPARAAYALRAVERSAEEDAAVLLAAAGVKAPRRAVREAADAARAAEVRLLASGELDPCVLHARPADLMRRRQHVRAGAAAAVAVVLAVALLGVPGDDDGTAAFGPSAQQQAALDPALVARADTGAWLRTDRQGYDAWPARGARKDDRTLIGRALAAWARPGSGVRVSATAGTARTPPVASPRLLYAGDLDGAGVVLLFDGLRLVRYAEPLDGDGTAALDFARVDAGDGVSASAVVLDRSDGNARYLTAPWIDRVELRDLLGPTAAARPVRRSADGVTDPVPSPTANPGCDAPAANPAAGWPALFLTPRSGVPTLRPFLLTDLDDLAPVHLTYAVGAGARQTEADSPAAWDAWAHTACRLATLRGQGVRTAGTWRFADQPLPEGAGSARWLCTRADTWSGDDHVLLQFLPPTPAGKTAGGNSSGAKASSSQASGGKTPAAKTPGAKASAPGPEAKDTSATSTPAAVSAIARSTPACGAMDPAVLTGVLWKSPAGHWYLLAAGSSEVASVTVSGGVDRTAQGGFLAAPATPTTRAVLTARLRSGGSLGALK